MISRATAGMSRGFGPSEAAFEPSWTTSRQTPLISWIVVADVGVDDRDRGEVEVEARHPRVLVGDLLDRHRDAARQLFDRVGVLDLVEHPRR